MTQIQDRFKSLPVHAHDDTFDPFGPAPTTPAAAASKPIAPLVIDMVRPARPVPLRCDLAAIDRLLGRIWGPDAPRAMLAAMQDTTERSGWYGFERRQLSMSEKTLSEMNVYVCNGIYRGRRAKENVERIGFYVFDDIGSKVSYAHVRKKLADGSVPVFAEIETSVGNETWLVLARDVDNQAAFARYTALQRAMGRHGLTDPAMKDLTRYVRLPIGRNTKAKYQDKKTGRFPRVGLLAFDNNGPGFTPDELAMRLGIDLDAEILSENIGSQAHAGQAVLAAGASGGDPYVHALHELGMVLGAPKHNGYLDIRCPWEHEHTVRGDTGTGYLPGGGWECHHGHCSGRSTETFKAKVRDLLCTRIGSPAEPWLAAKTFEAHAAKHAEGDDLENSPVVQALADKLGAGGAKGSGGVPMGGTGDPEDRFFRDVVFVSGSDKFYSFSLGVFLSPRALNTVWTFELGPYLPAGPRGGQPPTPCDHFNKSQRSVIVSQPIYWPGRGKIVKNDTGDMCVNLWRPIPQRAWGRKIGSHEVRRWIKLALDLSNGNRRDARLLIDHLARVIYAQDWKPGWGIILKSRQGMGKDLLLSVLPHALGVGNVAILTPDRVGSKFNSLTEKRVAIVNEMKMTTRGSTSAHDAYNALKTLLSRTPAWLTVERKGVEPYSIPNRCAWYFTTNESAPIAMPEDDRRFMVIECQRQAARDPEFYRELVEWLEGADGYGLVSEWLRQRGEAMSAARVRVLDGNAPSSEAKRDMIMIADASPKSAVEEIGSWIVDQVGSWPDLMTTEDVTTQIVGAVRSGDKGLDKNTRIPKPRQLGWLFPRMGWKRVSGTNPVPMPEEKGGGTRHVWAVRNIGSYASETGLRQGLNGRVVGMGGAEGMTRGELARAYAKAHGLTAPKGADGGNVVELPARAKPEGASAPDRVEPVPPVAGDFPF